MIKCQIKQLLRSLYGDLNVQEICRLAGISRQTWYNTIGNKKVPSVEVAIRIRDALRISVECMTCEDNAKYLHKQMFLREYCKVDELWIVIY